MSILAQSPFASKRHFDENDSTACDRLYCTFKKPRRGSSPVSCSADAQQNNMSKDLNILLNLFLDFDDTVVRNAFFECHFNVEAASKKLGDMRLLKQEQESTVAEAIASNSVFPESLESRPDHDPACPNNESEATTSESFPTAEPHAEEAATAAEWVEMLVQEMSAATNIADARTKAASVLQRFESFVTFALKTQLTAEAEAAVRPRLTELTRENQVLKKAVQIQHRQAAELRQAASDAANAANAELRAVREQLDQSRERVRVLDLANYALTVHLERATNGSAAEMSFVHHRNPDVY